MRGQLSHGCARSSRCRYLAVNKLGVLRDDHDPNCTYEGDNNVLLKEVCPYLLTSCPKHSLTCIVTCVATDWCVAGCGSR